eukprot:comp21311_c0_seq1/m.45736 comp21311_c0_seq1/g.45736  ORF comp21311_c0_seq1/g.45736 comp21311_c0_seq1/m.45736 type:complete len:361 (-) comp21311_c0_seq1:850-1932(-)
MLFPPTSCSFLLLSQSNRLDKVLDFLLTRARLKPFLPHVLELHNVLVQRPRGLKRRMPCRRRRAHFLGIDRLEQNLVPSLDRRIKLRLRQAVRIMFAIRLCNRNRHRRRRHRRRRNRRWRHRRRRRRRRKLTRRLRWWWWWWRHWLREHDWRRWRRQLCRLSGRRGLWRLVMLWGQRRLGLWLRKNCTLGPNGRTLTGTAAAAACCCGLLQHVTPGPAATATTATAAARCHLLQLAPAHHIKPNTRHITNHPRRLPANIHLKRRIEIPHHHRQIPPKRRRHTQRKPCHRWRCVVVHNTHTRQQPRRLHIRRRARLNRKRHNRCVVAIPPTVVNPFHNNIGTVRPLAARPRRREQQQPWRH